MDYSKVLIALVQIPLDLEALGRAGVDFFSGNLHKWAFTPRGCGILWCHPKYNRILRPLVTSNNYHGSQQDQFSYPGTTDISNYLAAEAGLAFHAACGSFEAIYAHVKPMLKRAQKMIAQALNTEILDVPEEMEAPFLKCVGKTEKVYFRREKQEKLGF